MRNRRNHKGYSLIEILVVLAIAAIIGVISMARFNYYDVQHGCRSAAQVLVSELRLQQQRTLALERPYGITIAPGGDNERYLLWVNDGTMRTLRTSTLRSFPGNVHFVAGQNDYQVQFQPWTSGSGGGTKISDPVTPNTSEWAVTKVMVTKPDIIIQGRNRLQETITIDVVSGKITVTEQQL
jgi:prepilin-type N-terminal cleavage/methylation domain-containing protein